ncbi:MAG: DUF1512 domain-containing protein [Ignisphaera sp.]|uniref:DUF1512 domain-containing protein n=1 Tax=Ignisphaera aggregans TaxID=334771 RepID=A0A7J3MWW8_9CREN
MNATVLQQLGSDNWSMILSILFYIMFFLYLFTDLPQKAQFVRYERGVASRLSLIEGLIVESINKVKSYLSRLGIKDNSKFVDTTLENYFVIEPVSIEPTDIIRRLDHVITVNEQKFKNDLEKLAPELSIHTRNNIAISLSIASALYTVYKILRHYYLLGRKYENWVLLMQLYLMLPQLLRELIPYAKAIDGIVKGIPIGDSVGPLVAYKLIGNASRIDIEDDTVYSVVNIENRNVYVIKAKGPGSTVGRPGKAVAKIAEMLSYKVARIITIDAALKLEGEKTGLVAEGVGAAIGDPGPEKIEIERIAVKCNAPLDAVIVKMSNDEAIKPIKREIIDGVEKAYEIVLDIIKNRTKPGDNVIVVGIGNTVGVY